MNSKYATSDKESPAHGNRELCLPLRTKYPESYAQSLVVNTGTLSEYARACLGKREGAAVKPNIPSRTWELPPHDIKPVPNVTVPQALSTSLSSDQLGSELGTQRDIIYKAAICIEVFEYNEAIVLLDTVNATNTVLTCAVLFGRGLAHYKMERYARAESIMEHLRELAAKAPTNYGCGFMSEIYLGDIGSVLLEYEKAARSYKNACDLYTPNPALGVIFRLQTPSLSQLHVKHAGVLRKVNKVMQALEALREGVATGLDDKDLLAAHTSLGNLHQAVGDSQGAVDEYLECVRLAEKCGNMVALGWNHGNLGNAYVALQQREKAIHHLQRSLDLALQHEPTPQSIGRAYNNLGTAYQSLSELDKAKQYYERACDQSVYGKDTAGQARALGNLGNISMLRKDYDSAYKYFTDTLTITTDTAIKNVAMHNRGCCLYEKAELLLKTSARPCPQLVMTGRGIVLPKDVPRCVYLTDDITKLYEEAKHDLTQVISAHEDTLHTMKGSIKGLTLSVSLFEANSRTFHRLQDCLCVLGRWEEALACAEQSRARTLGELLLKRLGTGNITPPLTHLELRGIVRAQNQPVVFLSYTGSRLLIWVLGPDTREVNIQLYLDEMLFNEKTLDIYLRHGIPSEIADKDLDMFGPCDYSKPSALHNLHSLIGSRILEALSLVCGHQPSRHRDKTSAWPHPPPDPKEVILIPDSYTIMPFISLYDATTQTFMGDTYLFHTLPSILTMGIMNSLHRSSTQQQHGAVPLTVNIPGDSNQFCVVGDPDIPIFTHAGEEWALGRLPHATAEAKWVGHILCTTPTLHESATKPLVVAMLQRAKVIHIATHGSAVSGFLAFAELRSGDMRSGGDRVHDEKSVLLFPSEVEQLRVEAGLVVLSSCDSGRGTVRADGVQGMCRAFLVAGAQAILTTLWRVPDESTGVFMQFFYRYLMDGLTSAQALQKAVLSVRFFRKYSKPVHWGAYQLTGRTVQFEVHVSDQVRNVTKSVGGEGSVFPRLSSLMALEGALLTDSDGSQPSDVQMLCGSTYVSPGEVAIDFVIKHCAHFDCILWLTGANREIFTAAQQAIPLVFSGPVLVIFDGITELNGVSPLLETLLTSPLTHIIIIYTSPSPPTALIREIDIKLVRGCTVLQLEPLSTILASQRMVHAILSKIHYAPHNKDQCVLAELASLTCGSPDLADLTAKLFCMYRLRSADPIEDINSQLIQPVIENPATNRVVVFADKLIGQLQMEKMQQFVLEVLSMFGPVPILQSVAMEIESSVLSASTNVQKKPLEYLLDTCLLKVYPSAIVKVTGIAGIEREIPLYVVPGIVSEAVLIKMNTLEALYAIAAAHKALEQLVVRGGSNNPIVALYCTGMRQGLLSMAAHLDDTLGSRCMEELYRPLPLLANEGQPMET